MPRKTKTSSRSKHGSKSLGPGPKGLGTKIKRISRPKGMRDLIGDEFYKFQGFFEKAEEIAIYYGFKPIETPILEKKEVFTSGIGTDTDIIEKEMYTLRTKGGDKLALRPEGTAPLVRAYIENGMHTYPQPVMLYHYGPFFRHDKPQRGRYREFFQFGLEILGTPKSIADAMVIRMALIMLKEAGLKNLCVLMNSIGGKECRPDYVSTLTTYYRKLVNNLCADCAQRLKSNPLRLLDCKNDRCRPFKEEAPEMISYLCDSCKNHFKEVLEYLDTMDIPYKIEHTLVRGIDYYMRTVFEIVNEEDEKSLESNANNAKSQTNTFDNEKKKTDSKEEKGRPPPSLASGGRYDYLARALGSKREVPGVGVAIGVDRVVETLQFQAILPRIIKKPKVYFIQIGYEAKLKSLAVIETLRKAKIPVAHSLSRDRLSVQLAIAEKLHIPYSLIIGQKEALENTVIVRDMNSRSQDTVKIEKLAEYLKKKT